MQDTDIMSIMRPIPRSTSGWDLFGSAVWWARTGLAIYGGYVLLHEIRKR